MASNDHDRALIGFAASGGGGKRRLYLWLLPLVLLGLACAGQQVQSPVAVWEDGRARVELEFNGDAKAVYVGGDFNDWNFRRNPFTQVSPGRWTCEITLAPGSYAYLLGVEREANWTLEKDINNSRSIEDARGRNLSLLDLKQGK